MRDFVFNMENLMMAAKNSTRVALSFIITLGFFVVIAAIILTTQDKTDHDMLYMLIGVLSTTVNQVYNFWFGSSHNDLSRSKPKIDGDIVTRVTN